MALGAPAAVVYKTHCTSIVDVLEDLKDKAEGELADLRKAETNAQHNYDMLEQSLEDLKAADGKRPGGREVHQSRGSRDESNGRGRPRGDGQSARRS